MSRVPVTQKALSRAGILTVLTKLPVADRHLKFRCFLLCLGLQALEESCGFLSERWRSPGLTVRTSTEVAHLNRLALVRWMSRF